LMLLEVCRLLEVCIWKYVGYVFSKLVS
jgi:hypothetical protein